MSKHRSLQILKGLSLVIALSVLGIVIARLAGWAPDIDVFLPGGLSATPTALNLSTNTASGIDSLGTKAPLDLPAGRSPTLASTLIGPATPADAWANVLLDRVLDALQQPRSQPDGFAWWQNSEAGGDLAFVDATLALGQQPLSLGGQAQIDISIPRQANPNQVERVASIAFAQGASTLTVYTAEPNSENEHWVLSSTEPVVAFEALVVQAAARAMVLKAAYIENPAGAAELVLVEAKILSTPTAVSTGVSSAVPITPSHTPTRILSSPTPTREPEPYMGKVIAAAIDPIIDNARDFVPVVVLDFANRHPRTGYLGWTEVGPLVGEQFMSVDQADELTFYALSPSDPGGSVSSFLKVVYTNNTTRLPERQVYFQGQRMEEILFWLVSHARERGGRLRIAYDDFGTRQAITVIGFDADGSPGD